MGLLRCGQLSVRLSAACTVCLTRSASSAEPFTETLSPALCQCLWCCHHPGMTFVTGQACHLHSALPPALLPWNKSGSCLWPEELSLTCPAALPLILGPLPCLSSPVPPPPPTPGVPTPFYPQQPQPRPQGIFQCAFYLKVITCPSPPAESEDVCVLHRMIRNS